MISVFVSYRRDDSRHQAGRLYDRLVAHFGARHVFKDDDSIPLGLDYREVLTERVAGCDVFLAVIGDAWLSIAGKSGIRRLDAPGDFVRIEIEAALSRKIPVIPVLVGDSSVPQAEELPESLRELAFRMGLPVRPDPDFHRDVDRLIHGINDVVSTLRERSTPRGPSRDRTESSPPPRPPEPVPTPRFTNSLGMTLVRIEPGEFLMGSTKAQIDTLLKQFPDLKREWYDGEQPQHPVKVTRPFNLAAHQVTVGQFRRFVEATGYQTDAERTGEGAYGLVGMEWKQDKRINWRNPGFDQGEDHPVVCVSHNDAVAFLAWLNGQEEGQNRSYRLPTEAEWEYAARAGTRGLYGGSDDPESLVRFANVADASLKRKLPNATCIRGDDGFVYTAPVGSFEPNAWHLHDMIGNVWEWCDDWYDAKFYQSSPREDPRITKEAPCRAIRGGSWINAPGYCRPADRDRDASGIRSGDLGFRVAAVQS
jgi:formylglycine-generating enzyme required for sulfatase activity